MQPNLLDERPHAGRQSFQTLSSPSRGIEPLATEQHIHIHRTPDEVIGSLRRGYDGPHHDAPRAALFGRDEPYVLRLMKPL
jgi:hypothetical protein